MWHPGKFRDNIKTNPAKNRPQIKKHLLICIGLLSTHTGMNSWFKND